MLFQRENASFLKLQSSFLMARNVGRLHEPENAMQDAPTNSPDVAHTGEHIRVQCFPLSLYIAALEVETVDYFSLDIEGNEIDVLETIPFNEIDIKARIPTLTRSILNFHTCTLSSLASLSPGRTKCNHFYAMLIIRYLYILGPLRGIHTQCERTCKGYKAVYNRYDGSTRILRSRIRWAIGQLGEWYYFCKTRQTSTNKWVKKLSR